MGGRSVTFRDHLSSNRKAPTPIANLFQRLQSHFRAARHKKLLTRLGLETGDRGMLLRAERRIEDRGVTTMLHAVATAPQNPETLLHPELLTSYRDTLAAETNSALSEAETAVKALIDLALDPAIVRWQSGGESAMRENHLKLPPSLEAPDALATAKHHYRKIQAATQKKRAEFLDARLKKLVPGTRLNGKELSTRFMEKMPLLTSAIEIELNVEASLSEAQTTQLIDLPDDALPKTVENMMVKARRSLVAKLSAQLKELAGRIRTLPHIELLTDDEISATVAPYYGGMSRDLKRRRAKSAFVAVEESAREAKYQGDVARLNEKRDAYADVASYYPVARGLKRKLVLYVGPTNSGKTWRALNDLAAASSGSYLAPLRLLALEGQEELEKRGRPTSFITGEERDLKPGSHFVSSTIEMLNVEQAVDAVVIDEVQLLADEHRGWAWLAALVGAPASTVIMTGSPDCVDIVKDLAAYLGEELTIHELTRHNELHVAPAPIRMRDIRPGTAIVCFSRRDVQRIKNTILENSELKVAVVYGNLSPQVRREEARRFRSGEAQILVATDAIAMGLNLPISEVLFYATEKFNGEEVLPLSPSDIRQIGGRAGRYGFAQFGVVNALDQKSLDRIRDALEETPTMLERPYYVAPGHNHVRIIGEVLGTSSLERILTFFERAIEFSDERFARSNIDALSYLSTFVDERLPFLDVTERLTIAATPVSIRSETGLRWFIDRMLSCFPDPEDPDRGEDDLNDLFRVASRFDHDAARTQLELRDAEDYLKTLTVYAWLAFRYPTVFTRIEECEARREIVNGFVERSLRTSSAKEKPPQRDRGGRRRR